MKNVLEARQEDSESRHFEVPAGGKVVIGRSDEADWKLAGDKHLSRRHVEIWVEGKRLAVRKLPEASNPVFFQGKAAEKFSVEPGGVFVIGATRFTFSQEAALESEHTLSEADLYGSIGGSDRMRLLDILELPDILRVKSPQEFFLHIAQMLRLSTGAAWVRIGEQNGKVLGEDASDDTVKGRKWSRTLVEAALKEPPRPKLYLWSQPQDLEASVQEGIDWAVCAGMQVAGQAPVVFYVAGSGSREEGSESRLREASRFVGLVADIVSRSLSLKRVENWEGRLEHYFSGPVIAKILESQDMKELDPKLAQSTVMFFDIRGFSKRTEGSNDKVLEFQGKLRTIMSAMTEEVFKEHGVVLQYMGDGILACWNLPLPDLQHIDRACRAALHMVSRFAEVSPGWRCGIGLHSGEVVAGNMGSDQVFSYTIMGAVVNQASRIEAITKVVGVPVLMTKSVAQGLSPETGSASRVGRFQPAGMNTEIDLFELTPPGLDAKRTELMTKGLKCFEQGDFKQALSFFSLLPSKDGAASYLKSLTEKHIEKAPSSWNGTIVLTEK